MNLTFSALFYIAGGSTVLSFRFFQFLFRDLSLSVLNVSLILEYKKIN